MRALLLVLLLAVAAGGLFATNPSAADFEAQIEAQIGAAIASADPDRQGNDVSALLLTACKAGGGACARLLRSLMTIEVTDQYLFSTAEVRLGDGEPLTCYGVLTRVLCPNA